MTNPEHSLKDLVHAGREQTRFMALHWEGSFYDYLDLVEANPLTCRNAWQRMLDMIEHHGSVETPEGGRSWTLFSDPLTGGKDAIYGLDGALASLVKTIRAGAHGFGPERRVILLHGPVGSSKSTIARLLKRGLEAYSRTDEGALYTFTWDVDGEVIPSPMNQDPILLVPADARPAFDERMNQSSGRAYRPGTKKPARLGAGRARWMEGQRLRAEGELNCV
jgi:serine protein kinase